MGKHYYKNPQEGDIKIYPANPNAKWRYTNGKWVYIKKPKGYFKKDQPKKKWVNNFPPVTLPDHIKPTKYPHYYVSNDGIAYREPRRCDENGRFGEVNEWGLIKLTTTLRGNPNYGEEFMYEGINIYLYDENGKNIQPSIKINIHQLVAQVWIPNPHGYTEVLHGDKGNRCNHYTNLRWGTHKENMKEAKSAAPEGTIRLRKKEGKRGSLYEKRDGEWVLIPSTFKGAPDGTISVHKNGERRIKKDGKWIYIPKYPELTRKPDGTITTRADGTKWKKQNGEWVYQKKGMVNGYD